MGPPRVGVAAARMERDAAARMERDAAGRSGPRAGRTASRPRAGRTDSRPRWDRLRRGAAIVLDLCIRCNSTSKCCAKGKFCRHSTRARSFLAPDEMIRQRMPGTAPRMQVLDTNRRSDRSAATVLAFDAICPGPGRRRRRRRNQMVAVAGTKWSPWPEPSGWRARDQAKYGRPARPETRNAPSGRADGA